MKLPRIMLTASASGSGKTLITCGILQALVNRGLSVASFKCGPDYIDPMFHGRIIGTRSKNLDTFFTDKKTTQYLFGKTAKEVEVSVVEGVMGYYDGMGGRSVEASSYDLAKTLKIPAVLIVNCKGMSMSVIPVIKGFLEYKQDSNIKGVILNQMPLVLYEDMKEIIEAELPVKVLGYVPPVKDLVLESRHLGLVLPNEIEQLKEKLQKLSQVIEESIDLDAFLEMAESAEEMEYEEPELAECSTVKIGVAYDEAFCFIYEDNLDLLKRLGAELVYFSPIKDQKLPQGIQGIILSGGYPELYARELSENSSMRNSIRQAVEDGMPCIAECGGFMYLHRELEAADGNLYPMAGVIDAKTFRTPRLRRFGYIVLTSNQKQLLLDQGEEMRGHEFHYWDSESCGESMTAQKPARKQSWLCVHGNDTLYAGFPHLFYYSNLKVPVNFLKKCEEAVCWS